MGAGGLGAIYSDFAAGVYGINGALASYGEVWAGGEGDVTPGVGLVLPGGPALPVVMSAAAAAALNAGSLQSGGFFSIICQYTINRTANNPDKFLDTIFEVDFYIDGDPVPTGTFSHIISRDLPASGIQTPKIIGAWPIGNSYTGLSTTGNPTDAEMDAFANQLTASSPPNATPTAADNFGGAYDFAGGSNPNVTQVGTVRIGLMQQGEPDAPTESITIQFIGVFPALKNAGSYTTLGSRPPPPIPGSQLFPGGAWGSGSPNFPRPVPLPAVPCCWTATCCLGDMPERGAPVEH